MPLLNTCPYWRHIDAGTGAAELIKTGICICAAFAKIKCWQCDCDIVASIVWVFARICCTVWYMRFLWRTKRFTNSVHIISYNKELMGNQTGKQTKNFSKMTNKPSRYESCTWSDSVQVDRLPKMVRVRCSGEIEWLWNVQITTRL